MQRDKRYKYANDMESTWIKLFLHGLQLLQAECALNRDVALA